jgi:hypothetical protein
LRAQFFAGDEFSGVLKQDCEHLQRLALEAQLDPVLPQLAGASIELEGIEAMHAGDWRGNGYEISGNH